MTQIETTLPRRHAAARVGRAALAATLVSFAVTATAQADFEATYSLAGVMVTPLANAFVQEIQKDFLLEGEPGTPAPWSTGTFTVLKNEVQEITNTYTVFNGELLGCAPGDTAETPPAERTCDPPTDDLIDPVLDYGGIPPIKNVVRIQFRGVDSFAELAASETPVEIEITELDWINPMRTQGFDIVIIVGGLFHDQLSGAVGTLKLDGTVDEWSTPLSGMDHTEVFCTGSVCEADEEKPLNPEELLILDDPIDRDLAVTGEQPATCVAKDTTVEDCPPSKLVPASESLNFQEDFGKVFFEINASLGGVHRVYWRFRGTYVPEPTSGLLQAGAVGALGLMARRRRRAA